MPFPSGQRALTVSMAFLGQLYPSLQVGPISRKKDLSTGTSQIRVGGPHVILCLRYLLPVLVTRGPMGQCNHCLLRYLLSVLVTRGPMGQCNN